MLILDSGTKSLEVLLGAVAVTTDPSFTVSYVDIGTAAFNPADTDGQTNGTTPVTLLAGPGTGFERQVKQITIHNDDQQQVFLTLRLNNNGTYRNITSTTLGVNSTLQYTDGEGFFVIDTNGAVLTTDAGSSLSMTSYIAGSGTAVVLGPNSLAIGNTVLALGTSQTVIGYNVSYSGGADSIVIVDNQSGTNTLVNSIGSQSLTLGYTNTGSIGAQGLNSIAIGNDAKTDTGGNDISIGVLANAAGAGDSIAIGHGASTSGSNNICIGHNAHNLTAQDHVILIGSANITNNPTNAIRIGYAGTTGGLNSLGIGPNTNDNLQDYNLLISSLNSLQCYVNSSNSISINGQQDGGASTIINGTQTNNGGSSILIGVNSGSIHNQVTDNQFSVAIGNNIKDNNPYSFNWGNGSFNYLGDVLSEKLIMWGTTSSTSPQNLSLGNSGTNFNIPVANNGAMWGGIVTVVATDINSGTSAAMFQRQFAVANSTAASGNAYLVGGSANTIGTDLIDTDFTGGTVALTTTGSSLILTVTSPTSDTVNWVATFDGAWTHY